MEKNSEDEPVPELSEYLFGLSESLKARIQKLEMFHKYSQAMMKDDFVGMLEALKFPEDLLEEMTYPEITEAMIVRVADLAKEVGVDIHGND